MESDRIETNLGPMVDDTFVPEPQAQTKQPKRRFIGRRTAQQLENGPADRAPEDFEDKSSLQGLKEYFKNFEFSLIDG
jgi:2-(3-amino-3-carboxypropyl)histidine synthase